LCFGGEKDRFYPRKRKEGDLKNPTTHLLKQEQVDPFLIFAEE